MNLLIFLFVSSFSSSTYDLNKSIPLFEDVVQYIQYESQNIFIEQSPSQLYFFDNDNFKLLHDFNQSNLTENITYLRTFVDEQNNPDLFFLFSTLLYFGVSIDPNISLSMHYLSKASSMNHSLAQVLQLILNEDENDIFDYDSFNQLYLNSKHDQKYRKNKNNMQFPYAQFYIANKLYYDYLKTNNSEQCLNILKVYGIERQNLHIIPDIRSNSSCYKIYKMFRHHKNQEAINLIRSIGDRICFDEFPYSDKKPIDDPYIVSYYISKYNCDLSIEFLRHSLQNNEALNLIIEKANEMERKQKLDYSLKLHKILSHLGIESSIENSIRISKILNLNVPPSIRKLKKLNDQIKKEKCINDLSSAYNFRNDLLKSLSYLKHAIQLFPQSIFVASPLRLLIIYINLINSKNDSKDNFNALNIIQTNIDLMIFCVGIIALAFFVKIRVELFFMTSQ